MPNQKQKRTYALVHFRDPRSFSLAIFLIMALMLVACGLFGSVPEVAEVQPAEPTPTLKPTFTPLPAPTDRPLLPQTVTVEPSPTPVPQAGLSGRIFDEETDQPVADAQVNVGTVTAATNPNGRYTLTGLPPGRYILSVTHPDYDPGLSRIFTLAGGQDLLLDLALYAPETSPYPADPMLTNPLDPNGAPTPEEAERLARLQGFSGEVVNIRETKLSGEFLVNYKIGDEIRAAVAEVRHEVWELIDEMGQKWWIIKVCGNLAQRLPEQASIPTPEPRPLPPMAKVVVNALQARSCPAETCAKVGTIERGAQVEVLGCLADGGWCQVSLPDGKSGWCSGQSLYHLAIAEAVPVVEAEGGKIAFLSDRDREPGLADIYLMNPDGSDLTRLTTGLHLASVMANSLYDMEDRFAWSETHQKFFFTTGSGELYSVNTNGSGVTFIADQVYRFDLSPDGQYIAFGTKGITVTATAYTVTPQGTTVTETEVRRNDIAIMNTDGTAKVMLTDETTSDNLGLKIDYSFHAPVWSPDGSKIAFNAAGRLAIMNSDGTNPVLLTPPEVDVMEPLNWSPDGLHISFGGSSPYSLINVVDKTLSSLPVKGHDFVWSPDGSKIAFYQGGPMGYPPGGPLPQPDISQGEWQIWVMNADGSGLTQLTFAGHNCCPVWVD